MMMGTGEWLLVREVGGAVTMGVRKAIGLGHTGCLYNGDGSMVYTSKCTLDQLNWIVVLRLCWTN